MSALVLVLSVGGVSGCSLGTIIGGGNGKNPVPATANAVKNDVVQKIAPTKTQGLRSELNQLHDDANQWVGYNHTPKWSTWDKKEPGYFQSVAKVKQQIEDGQQDQKTKAVVEDLRNAESLLKIAKKDHSRQALLYFHRIMSDLANFVYSSQQGEEYWGATNVLHGKEAPVINSYVKSHS